MVFDQGTKEVYFEDNSFVYDGAFASDDMLDCFNGGRYVFRHNTVNGNDTFGHGYDSVSTSCLEITAYSNTMNVNNSSAPGAILYRGGTGVVYSNSMSGTHYAGYISIQNYRSNSGGANTCATGRTNCNLCNGANPIDGNIDGGWPCYQGPGRGSGNSSSGLASYPIYQWDNGGTSVVDINDSFNSFHANRDWYDSQSTGCSGTQSTGVCSGALASRASNCTTGVAYWATDQSKLYKCSSTNTWSVYYSPFTYPHPLQGGGTGGSGLMPPTNVSVIVR
jgi:hypothetical protein